MVGFFDGWIFGDCLVVTLWCGGRWWMDEAFGGRGIVGQWVGVVGPRLWLDFVMVGFLGTAW